MLPRNVRISRLAPALDVCFCPIAVARTLNLTLTKGARPYHRPLSYPKPTLVAECPGLVRKLCLKQSAACPFWLQFASDYRTQAGDGFFEGPS